MKGFKYIFISIIILFTNITCLAWVGDYNYEVTSFEVDATGRYATISGWAILNGRDGSTGTGTTNDRQSGILVKRPGSYTDSYGNRFKDGYCSYGSNIYTDANNNPFSGSYDSDYNYQYSFQLYKVFTNSKKEKISNDYIQELTPNTVSLTYAQAYKCSSIGMFNKVNCISSKPNNWTACYEDVGFKFRIDLNGLSFNDSIKGYSMYLKVTTGSKSECSSNCTQTIPLTIVAPKVDFDSGVSGISLINTTTQVQIIVTGGQAWLKPGFSYDKGGSYLERGNTTYTVDDIAIANNVTWYKLDRSKEGISKYVWVPASWVNSSGGITLISNNPQKVEKCIVDANPAPIVNNAKTCNQIVNSSVTTDNSCKTTVTSNKYYSVVCDETLAISFNPGNLTIKSGQGFSYGIKVVSTNSCVGTFNTDAWLEAYNVSIRERNNYAKTSAEYKEKDNIIKELLSIVNSYNQWEFNSNINPTAVMGIEYKRKGKTVKDQVSFVVIDVIDPSYTKKITTTHNLNISGLTNPSNFTLTKNSTVNLVLPKQYINQINGNVSSTNCSNCLDAGNMYYMDTFADVGNYSLAITVSDLGNFKNVTVNNNKCDVTITGNLANSIYRPIDITNPFIDAAREIGDNWLNNSYSFVATIKKDTWSENGTPKYVFNLTKQNINDIKKSNSLIGGNAYLGSDCKISSSNNYECSFIRNNAYFHSVYINGQLILD